MNTKFLFILSSVAEENTYKYIISSLNNIFDYIILDITKYSSYKLKNIFENKDNYILLEKNKYFPKIIIFGKLLRLLDFKYKFRRICDTYNINNVVMGSDKEPLNLLIIKYCSKHNIKTTVFQHGLYIPDTEEYESEIYKNRFNRTFLILYKYIRKVLRFSGILPERKPTGKNGASQYYFYSQYYVDMFVRNNNEINYKIVGPVKYDLINENIISEKYNLIVYANCLINKWYPHFEIDDKEIFREIVMGLPRGFKLLIKPHPSENISDYENLLCDISGNYEIINPSDSIEKYLIKSKIFISYITSVIYDAIYYNNTVIILDLLNGKYIKCLDGLFVIPFKKEIIKNTLLNLSDIINNEKIKENQQKLFVKHLGNINYNNGNKFIKYLIEDK